MQYELYKAEVRDSVMKALDQKRDQLIFETIWKAENPEVCHIENGKVVMNNVDPTQLRIEALRVVNAINKSINAIKKEYRALFEAMDKES
jgi:hypothetical protein